MTPRQAFSRRQFLQFSAAAGATLALAACAPSAPAPAAEGGAAAPAAEAVKLQYQSREPENAAGVKEMWDLWYGGFREQNPNIEVEWVPDAGGNAQESALAAMVAGNASDLIEWCCTQSRFFIEQKQTLNLQPLIDRDAEEVNIDDYYAHQFDGWRLDGDIHMLPRFTGTQVIYYNKDWFDRVGEPYPGTEWGSWTWEDFQRIGAKFVGENPQTWATSSYHMYGDWVTMYWLRGWGAHMVNPDDNTHCPMDEPEAQECLEWLRAQTWDRKQYVVGTSALSGGLGPEALFTSERIGMMEMGPWNLNVVMDAAQFKWDVAPMVNGPAGTTTHQSVDGCMIWKDTPHPEESWLLLKGTTSPEYGILYAKYANKQPSRKSILNEFPKLLREQNEKYNEISLEVFTDSLAQDIGGTEEFFKYDDASKTQIIKPAMEKLILLGEATPEYVGKHAQVVTRFNRDEFPPEQLGAELAKITQ